MPGMRRERTLACLTIVVMTMGTCSAWSVYFDEINLLVQENHYDAFGLALTGIEKKKNWLK